jgi:hypothetical protein
MGNISGFSFQVEDTPVISTSAYAAGDQIGGINTIWPGITDKNITYVLQSISVVDKAGQEMEIEIHFFDSLPTVASVDNAAVNITDAELADKYAGSAIIKATDYQTFGGSSNSVGSVDNIGLAVKPTTDGGGKMYTVMVIRGAGDYASTSDLVVRYNLAADL